MRKKSLFFLLVIPLLLSGALWGIKRKRDGMAVVILSRYPQDPNFSLSVAVHFKQLLNPLRTSSTSHSLLLTSSFVGGNMNEVRWSNVEDTGKVDTALETSHWQTTGKNTVFCLDPSYKYERSLQLKAAQMEFLRSSLPQMPSSDAPKLRGDLLLVSFEDAGLWQTRVYNKKSLPNRVKQVLVLTGQQIPLL